MPFENAMITACSTNDAGTNWGQSGADSDWQLLPQVDEFPNGIGLGLPLSFAIMQSLGSSRLFRPGA